ncbi:U6 snRNA-associated Sm-like protein LSm7 [Centruroides sculpturatus]|uniref:U6 snRNA-associated Sm-like protein LSm7 n=1 Tax=Centruroides sculpturatus TaxID=218467 RepID=UPI000C6D872F|nr:U6 snRNA-associated Sm-like protein LSm7 [Centruroides sculpturatus]
MCQVCGCRQVVMDSPQLGHTCRLGEGGSPLAHYVGPSPPSHSIVHLAKPIMGLLKEAFLMPKGSTGILKGYDPLLNLVLDNTTEYQRDPDDPYKLTDDTRHLGLVVCRGTAVVVICPLDGMESIPNPFVQHE